MDLVIRIGIVAAILGLAFGIVPLLERRRGRTRATELAPGIAVVVAPGCVLCGPTVDALRRAGVRPQVIDASDPRADALRIRAVPTLLELGPHGEVLLRRTGRSALEHAGRLLHDRRG